MSTYELMKNNLHVEIPLIIKSNTFIQMIKPMIHHNFTKDIKIIASPIKNKKSQ